MNITDIYPMDALETLALQRAIHNKLKNFVYSVKAKEGNKPVIISISFSINRANSIYVSDDGSLVVQLLADEPVQHTKYTEEDVKKIAAMRQKDSDEDEKPKKKKVKKNKNKKKKSGKKLRRIM